MSERENYIYISVSWYICVSISLSLSPLSLSLVGVCVCGVCDSHYFQAFIEANRQDPKLNDKRMYDACWLSIEG